MRKSLIAAFDENFLVGADDHMPWDLPDDMRLFRRLTMGKPVIMGRKTFESIGKPLPGRKNIVLSSRAGFVVPGCDVAHSLSEAFDLAEDSGAQECMVMGGARVYEQAIWEVDRMYLSFIHHTFPVKLARDKVYFPRTDWWEYRAMHPVKLERHATGPGSPYPWTFMTIDFDPDSDPTVQMQPNRARSMRSSMPSPL